MKPLFNLVIRNNKVFFRDKTLVFFSLLSIFIVIMLYALFLQKMQIEAIEQITTVTPAVELMVKEWLVAGLLSMIAVTTTLGAFSITVQDVETKMTADFLTAPISRSTIQLSYVVSAFVIGSLFSFIALIGCELYLVATGGQWLSIGMLLKVIGILLLSVSLASVLNLFLSQFIRTQKAFSTLNTIVGTLIGFLCGVYVPLGIVPSFAQNIIMYFPVSHTTVLLRDTIMQDSLHTVFKDVSSQYAEAYKLNYGVMYEMNGHLINSFTSAAIILSATAVFAFASITIFKYKTN